MKKYYNILLIFFLLILPSRADSQFDSWAFQLQNVDLQQLKSSSYDMLVIDYSKEGDDNTAFSKSEISDLKSGNDNRKVISYISIGEAEDYRSYWKSSWKTDPPVWLDKENPEWEGNYKVQYWNEEWQAIIIGYLDKILDVGFDGVYLDIIDAYEYYIDDYPNAIELMIDFVEIIANYTRNNNSEFMIIPQNGEEIVNDRYLGIVDGIGRESVYVIDTNEERDKDETKTIEGYLDMFLVANKSVFVIDYADEVDAINYAKNSAESKGYISYITTVDLDQLGVLSTKTKTLDINSWYFSIIVLVVIVKRYTNSSRLFML